MLKKTLPIMLAVISTCTFAAHKSHQPPHPQHHKAEKVAAQPDPNAELVKTTMMDFMKENNVEGVAVEMYVDGKPRTYNFGYANAEKKKPITQNTIFEVGSITKLMTSLLFAQEVDAAKVQLTDPITHYMTTLPDSYKSISLQSLATHTAGFPFLPPENVKSENDLQQYLRDNAPTAAINQEWQYSNFSIGMLGMTLEAITHENFDQLYRQRILAPLRMQQIGLVVPEKLLKNYAQGYDKDNNPVERDSLGLFPAAADVKASASDMQKFLSAAIGLPGTPPRILYPMRMTQATYVELPDKMQGLGWTIHPFTEATASDLLIEPEEMNRGPLPVKEVLTRAKYNGDALIDKTGGTPGFRSYIAVIPNKKTGIVILTNHFVSNKAIVETGRELLFKVNNIKTESPHEEGSDENNNKS